MSAEEEVTDPFEEIVRYAARTYVETFPDAKVRVYRTDGGAWAWEADGVKMFSIGFDTSVTRKPTP